MKKFLMLVAVASLLIASVGCKKKEPTLGEKLDQATEAAEDKAAEVKKAAEKAAE